MATEEANQEQMPKMHPSILKIINQKKEIKTKLAAIKHKIGVYSAKGGVGKTTVAVNLAFAMKEQGYSVGLLDADIDCPNVTLFLGISDYVEQGYPLKPQEVNGVKVLSTAMFTDDAKKPIIWRGPLIAKMISEFFENTEWGELDYLIIDLPPGTSDAPLSIIQLLELDGFVIVTTPPKIASINAMRSGMMAKRLGVAILGVVENMSSGDPKGGKETAEVLGCDFLGTIKNDPALSTLSDEGKVPVLEDERIRQEFINIIKKITNR